MDLQGTLQSAKPRLGSATCLIRSSQPVSPGRTGRGGSKGGLHLANCGISKSPHWHQSLNKVGSSFQLRCGQDDDGCIANCSSSWGQKRINHQLMALATWHKSSFLRRWIKFSSSMTSAEILWLARSTACSPACPKHSEFIGCCFDETIHIYIYMIINMQKTKETTCHHEKKQLLS